MSEAICDRCGDRNLRSWFVPKELWAEAGADPAEVLCPRCFDEALSERTGHAYTWELIPRIRVLLAALGEGT